MAFREAQPGGPFRPDSGIIHRLNRSPNLVAKNPSFTPTPSSDIVIGSMAPVDSSAEGIIGQNSSRDGGVLNAAIVHPGRPRTIPDNDTVPAGTPDPRPSRERKGVGKIKGAAIVLVGGTALGAAGLGIMYKTGLLDRLAGNDDSGKATVADAGDLVKSDPPTTTDGKQIVVGDTPTATPVPETPTPEPTVEVAKAIFMSPADATGPYSAKAQQGELTLVDSWTAKGAVDKPAKTAKGTSELIIDGLDIGDTFDSPVMGTVKQVLAGQGNGFTVRSVILDQGNGHELTIIVDFGEKVLVTTGQKITLGSPIIEMQGNMLSPRMGASEEGQIAIYESIKGAGRQNLVSDSEGTRIAIGSAK